MTPINQSERVISILIKIYLVEIFLEFFLGYLQKKKKEFNIDE